MLRTDVDLWGDAEQDEFYRLLGKKLLEMWKSGVHPAIIDAVYNVAEDIVGEAGDTAITMGDDLANDWLHNTIDRYDTGWLVFMSWDGDHPGASSSAGLSVLDFGSGVLFVAEPPDMDTGRWWEITDVIDPTDQGALHNAVVDFLYRGMIPDRIEVSAPITRDLVKGVLMSSLDGSGLADWGTLSAVVGEPASAQTDKERSALLDRYLDEALTIT